MTKDEIKALIAAKIAGQGTAVDAGSVLPTILNGIIDLIPSGVFQCPILSLVDFNTLGVTGTEDEILSHILYNGEAVNYTRMVNIFTNERVWPTIIAQLPEQLAGESALQELAISEAFYRNNQLRITVGLGIEGGFELPGIQIELNHRTHTGNISVLYF